MALFKIFRRKQSSGDKGSCGSKGQSPTLVASDIWEQSIVHMPPLRLIIYRENEWKERRLLYDSVGGSAKKSQTKTTASPGKTPQEVSHLPSGNLIPFYMDEEEPANSNHAVCDAKSIAEMMFGSIGMYSKGHVIKLHEMRNPTQIMLTHLFQLSPKNRRFSQPVIRENIAYEKSAFSNDCQNTTESDSDSQYSTINSMDNFLIVSNQRLRSCNVRIPRSCSSQEQSKNSTSRHRKTNLSCSPEPGGSQDRSATGTPSTPAPITASWKSLQLSYTLNSFENLSQRRHSQAAGCLSEEDDAWSELCASLRILYESPRLSSPVWYSLTCWNDELVESQSNVSSKMEKSNADDDFTCSVSNSPKFSSKIDASQACQNFPSVDPSDESTFVKTLCELARTLDTKETNFFLSTALTTFLALHSGWVSSVAPPTLSTLPTTSSGQTKSNFKDIRKTSYRETIRSNVNVFAAQLLDLWSVFNSDHHSLRTLFVGLDEDLLAKLILVFSYFLRCNSLKKSSRFASNCCKNQTVESNDDFSQVHDRNLGEEQIFNIKNDINYGGNYGPSCNLTDFLYNKMACCSQENLDENQANCTMEVDEDLHDNLGDDAHLDMPKRDDPGEFSENFDASMKSKTDFDRTVESIFSTAKIDNFTHEIYSEFFDAGKNENVKSFVNSLPSIMQSNLSKEENSNIRHVDLNNNRQKIWRRFDDPGLSLQTSLQKLCPAEFHHGTVNMDATNSCMQFNANFALSAVFVQPPPSHSRRQSSSATRSPRSGASSTSNGHYDGSLLAPKTDQQTIREALLRTVAQCDSAYMSAIDFLVADCRDWSVKVLSCDVSNYAEDIKREGCDKKSSQILEHSCLPARTVLDMLENVKLLHATNAEPEFILVYMEDWLTDIYHRGMALASLIDESLPHSDQVNKIVPLDALDLLGADPSDAPLLLSVCAF